MFLQWVIFYSNIDELPNKERPAPHIIEDDALLNNWIKEREAKAALEMANSGAESNTRGPGNWGKGSVTIGG